MVWYTSPYFSGPWVPPLTGQWIRAERAVAGATAVTSGAVDRIQLYPFYFPSVVSISDAANVVTTFAASAKGRVLIYETGSNGYPTNLLAQSADLDYSSNGTKTATCVFTTSPARQYWCGVWHNSTAVISSFQLTSIYPLPQAAVNGTGCGMIVRNGVSFAGSAPDPWNYVAGEDTTASPPAIWFKAA